MKNRASTPHSWICALHNYKSQSATPAALRNSIDTLENRFNFAAFAGAGAFKQAYFQPTGQFGCCTYGGYTNENKVIALAAALSTAHNVPLARMWNGDVGRTATSLVTPENYLVYSYGTDYREHLRASTVEPVCRYVESRGRQLSHAFARAKSLGELCSLRSRRIGETHPARAERLHATRCRSRRRHVRAMELVQQLRSAKSVSAVECCRVLLAGAPGADDALRYLLDNGLGSGLDGPLGLADSAQWATGAANPTDVPSFADNWNITLSTMALIGVPRRR